MPRIARPRAQEEGCRAAAEKRLVSRMNAAAEPLDDAERKFLEPVARYLAILQEWSLERLSDGTGTVPPEQP
jgi:hypothetical protein